MTAVDWAIHWAMPFRCLVLCLCFCAHLALAAKLSPSPPLPTPTPHPQALPILNEALAALDTIKELQGRLQVLTGLFGVA